MRRKGTASLFLSSFPRSSSMPVKKSYIMTRQEALLFRALLADRVEDLRSLDTQYPDNVGIKERIAEYREIILKINAFGL